MAQMPDPFPSLLARIKRIEDRLNQRLASSPFFGTPIRPQADGSVQSDDFDGDLSTDNAGTKGWALSSLKAAFGELILRPGSIGNDALTNPTVAEAVYAQVTNFGLNDPDKQVDEDPDRAGRVHEDGRHGHVPRLRLQPQHHWRLRQCWR